MYVLNLCVTTPRIRHSMDKAEKSIIWLEYLPFALIAVLIWVFCVSAYTVSRHFCLTAV